MVFQQKLLEKAYFIVKMTEAPLEPYLSCASCKL